MFDARLPLLAMVAALAFCAGCAPLNSSSAQQKILEKPDPAFFKRVKNDPFPSASQATTGQPASAPASSPQSSAPKPLNLKI